MKTYRDIRLWHWKQAMHLRNMAKMRRGQKKPKIATALDKEANMHIKAVQTLNDAPGCTATTAEQDLKHGY